MKTQARGAKLMLSAGIALTLAIGMLTTGRTASAAGPAPVGLGTAAAFAVLAGTPDVTNTGATTITGDLGIHPAAAVSGFPPGLVNGTIHAGDAIALQAKNDLVLAYTYAAAQPVTATHGTLGGLTLVGGVYNAGGVTLDLTGTLTLDGQSDPSSVWIFQASSDLITASSSSVAFINGAQPCNVFWQVTSSATLGSGSSFVGTILALTSITVNNGVTVNGRVLARNGTVTLDNDTITRSTCASTSRPRPFPTANPSATPTAAASPTPAPTTPAPTAAATPAPTAAATATPIAATSAAPTTPPSGATPEVLYLPATATLEDNALFVALPILIIVFAVLWMLVRARARRRGADHVS